MEENDRGHVCGLFGLDIPDSRDQKPGDHVTRDRAIVDHVIMGHVMNVDVMHLKQEIYHEKWDQLKCLGSQ